MSTPDQEEFGVIPRELREAIARVKGHANVEDDQAKTPAAEVLPFTAKVEAWLDAEENFLSNPPCGYKMPDGTIFLGKYRPKDNEGKSLRQTFNVFATAEDLKDGEQRNLGWYEDTVALLAGTKNLHGYDGANYKDDRDLREALKDGSYKGEWIVPPCELLMGTMVNKADDTRAKIIQPANLYACQEKGTFRDTFTTKSGPYRGPRYGQNWYWSSSVLPGFMGGTWAVRFDDALGATDFERGPPHACRPVRLIPCPSRQTKPA